MKVHQNIILIVVLLLTVVMLCVLPLVCIKNNKVYVYTQTIIPNSQENGFIEELKALGYSIEVNSNKELAPKDVSVWFKSNQYTMEGKIKTNSYTFLYNEDYYPYHPQSSDISPVILTPYKDLYEHYARSNIRSAEFFLGMNAKDFIYDEKGRQYIVYYELRNQDTEVSGYLSNNDKILFVGRFWQSNVPLDATDEYISKKYNTMLQKSRIVIIENTPNSKLIPQEILHATASGALVVTRFNQSVYNVYGDNLIYFNTVNELDELIQNNLSISSDKIKTQKINARKITIENLTTQNSAKRFDELLKWMKSYY